MPSNRPNLTVDEQFFQDLLSAAYTIQEHNDSLGESETPLHRLAVEPETQPQPGSVPAGDELPADRLCPGCGGLKSLDEPQCERCLLHKFRPGERLQHNWASMWLMSQEQGLWPERALETGTGAANELPDNGSVAPRPKFAALSDLAASGIVEKPVQNHLANGPLSHEELEGILFPEGRRAQVGGNGGGKGPADQGGYGRQNHQDPAKYNPSNRAYDYDKGQDRGIDFDFDEDTDDLRGKAAFARSVLGEARSGSNWNFAASADESVKAPLVEEQVETQKADSGSPAFSLTSPISTSTPASWTDDSKLDDRSSGFVASHVPAEGLSDMDLSNEGRSHENLPSSDEDLPNQDSTYESLAEGAPSETSAEYEEVTAVPVSLVQRFADLRVKLRFHRADLYLGAAVFVAALALLWPVAGATQQPTLSPWQRALVTLGIAEAPAPTAHLQGDPAVEVWIDPHSALYYCPGEEQYGKTADGRFGSQREAEMERFEPASRSACE